MYNIQQINKSFDKLITSNNILWSTITITFCNNLYNIIGFNSASNKELYEIISKVHLLKYPPKKRILSHPTRFKMFDDIKCTFKTDVDNHVQFFNKELSNIIRDNKEFTDIMDIEYKKNEIIWQQDYYLNDTIELIRKA